MTQPPTAEPTGEVPFKTGERLYEDRPVGSGEAYDLTAQLEAANAASDPEPTQVVADGPPPPARPLPAKTAAPAPPVAREPKVRQHRVQGAVTRIMTALPGAEGVSTVLELAGIGTLTYGIWLKSEWIALVFLGFALILLGVAISPRWKQKPK